MGEFIASILCHQAHVQRRTPEAATLTGEVMHIVRLREFRVDQNSRVTIDMDTVRSGDDCERGLIVSGRGLRVDIGDEKTVPARRADNTSEWLEGLIQHTDTNGPGGGRSRKGGGTIDRIDNEGVGAGRIIVRLALFAKNVDAGKHVANGPTQQRFHRAIGFGHHRVIRFQTDP